MSKALPGGGRVTVVERRDAETSSTRPFLGRRAITIVLGSLWLIDGLLQLQPAQFTSAFATDLEMNAMAQPSFLGHLELAFGRTLTPHIASWNAAFALIQLALGVLILVPRTRRVGLAGSVAWASGVWLFGEGLGGIATGFAMLPNGAPGAALCYGLLAAALLASDRPRSRPRLLPLLRRAWVGILAGSVVLQITSNVSLSLKLRANFDGLSDGEPHLLAVIDQHVTNALAAHSGIVTASFVVVELAMLFAVLPAPRSHRATIPLLLLVLGLFWIFGENFAGLLTRSANDVGISPLLAVLALATFPRPGPRDHPAADTPPFAPFRAPSPREAAFT